MKKEGAEEEKEQEKLGKLEFSLDYNFTDAQVDKILTFQWLTHSYILHIFGDHFPFHSSAAHSGDPSGPGPRCHGHGGNLRPICQSLFTTRQKEEVWDQSSAQKLMSCFQWDFYLQGNDENIVVANVCTSPYLQSFTLWITCVKWYLPETLLHSIPMLWSFLFVDSLCRVGREDFGAAGLWLRSFL